MKKNHLGKLHEFQDTLTEVHWELKTYGTLFSCIYSEEALSGDELAGAGLSLKRCADQVQTICRELDKLSISVRRKSKRS